MISPFAPYSLPSFSSFYSWLPPSTHLPTSTRTRWPSPDRDGGLNRGRNPDRDRSLRRSRSLGQGRRPSRDLNLRDWCIYLHRLSGSRCGRLPFVAPVLQACANKNKKKNNIPILNLDSRSRS